MKKLLSLVYCLLFINIGTISLNAKIFIESKVNDKIVTNYDIKMEGAYLTILNPNLKEITNEKLIKLAKQSLIREIIKESEISKYFSINTDA
ncbi:peptidylprolyl isomerase, partial [Candidatus Pelagibacter sp.]|nr:peptidylprolyl isomerase [Candidatus Pelagibacter sp.]